MARSGGQFARGTITTVSQSADMQALWDVVHTSITAYQSGGVQAWEVYDNIDTRNKVYRSKGDRNLVGGVGDARLFVQIRFSETAIFITAYQDWSTLSHTGTNQSYEEQVTLDVAGNLAWATKVNEYEIAVLAVRATEGEGEEDIGMGARMLAIFAGSPVRSHVSVNEKGVAFSTAPAATTGSDVVIPLDRDLSSSIAVDQWIWIYDQTPLGSALVDPVFERLQVQAITGSTITLNIASDHLSGAIIGLDPCPCYSHAEERPTISNAQMILRFTNNHLGIVTSLNPGQLSPIVAGFTRTANDPQSAGQYVGVHGGLGVNATMAFRGYPQHIGFWSVPAGAPDFSLFRHGRNDALMWIALPRWLVIPESSMAGTFPPGWALCIGPEATL